MGNLFNIFKVQKSQDHLQEEINPEKSSLQNIKLPNPFFKNIKILTKDYKHSRIFFGLNLYELSCYDIYKLNSIKESFYLTFNNTSNIIVTLKYIISNNTIIKVNTIEYKNYIIKLKYFNDILQNQEILLVLNIAELNIYLIVSEEKYEKIYTYYDKDPIASDIGRRFHKLPMNDFIIFYNKYNKTNNVIISFFYRSDCTSHTRKISILKYKKNQLYKINEYFSDDTSLNNKNLFLIWKDKILNKYYLLTNIYDELKFFDIIDKTIINYSDCKYNFTEKKFGEYACILTNERNNRDNLYICNDDGIFTIIDLNTKEIIYKIGILVCKKINSIINWNNKYIVIGIKNIVYFLDTNNNKIISKYIMDKSTKIINIKKSIFDYTNHYLFIDSNNKSIKLLY